MLGLFGICYKSVVICIYDNVKVLFLYILWGSPESCSCRRRRSVGIKGHQGRGVTYMWVSTPPPPLSSGVRKEARMAVWPLWNG